jgi:flagellar hook-length control protein FliK
MSTIDFNPSFGLSLPDTNLGELLSSATSPDQGELFNDYLQRARSSSDSNGRQDESKTADNANPALPQELKSEVEKKPAEKGADDSRIEKQPEGKEKNPRDEQDSVDEEDNKANPANILINPNAANVKTDLKPGDIAQSAKAVAKPAEIACKDVKDLSAGEKTALLTQNEPQNFVAAQTDTTVVQSAKANTIQTTALKDGENAGELSAGGQNAESIPASVINNITAEQIPKAASSSARDARRKMSQQGEKKQGSDAGEASTTSDIAKDPYSTVPGDKAVVAQAVASQLSEPTKSTKKDTDISGIDAAGKNKTDMPANTQTQSGLASKAADGTGQQGGNESGVQVDQARFVQRIERAFAAIGDRGGSVRLKLSPPELGSVSVEISVNKGVMKARLEAETKETKNLLLENLPGLRDRLAQQNIKIQQFDVDLRDPSSGGMSQQTANQGDSGSRDGGYRDSRSQTRENTNVPSTAMETTRLVNPNGQLNVIV